jgi:hypothetical protein
MASVFFVWLSFYDRMNASFARTKLSSSSVIITGSFIVFSREGVCRSFSTYNISESVESSQEHAPPIFIHYKTIQILFYNNY